MTVFLFKDILSEAGMAAALSELEEQCGDRLVPQAQPSRAISQDTNESSGTSHKSQAVVTFRLTLSAVLSESSWIEWLSIHTAPSLNKS